MVVATTHKSGGTTSKLSKKDALKICSKCKNRNSAKCVFSDIEGSRKDTIIVPKCMMSLNKVNEKSSFTNEKSSFTNEKSSFTNSDLSTKNGTVWGERTFTPNEDRHLAADSFTKNDIMQGEKMIRSPPMRKVRSPLVSTQEMNDLVLTPLDWEIIEYLQDDMHVRGISNGIGRSQSTISYRVKRMEKAGLLHATKGVYGSKLYKLSKDLFTQMNESLIYNEERYQATDFTAHVMTFKYPILCGIQPKSKNDYKMNNWMGYVFKFNDHVIRTTPSSVLIDINLDLGAGSISDLILKYMDVAQPYILNFAKQHKLDMGVPMECRSPHYTIEDTAISQILTERGEFKTKGMGLSFDKSKSTGDLEMGEKSARAFEFTLNKLPRITDKINSKLSELNQTTTEEFTKTQSTLDQISDDVSGLYVLLQMKHENDKLREDYKEMLDLMKSQIDPKQSSSDQHTSKITVNDTMQIYG
jgi:DNA-binding Lrp family transcriptional regulator